MVTRKKLPNGAGFRSRYDDGMAQRPFTKVTPALQQAMQAFGQNDHLRAIHLCDTCLQANLHDVNAWHLKGRCLTAGGLYDLARKHLKNALVLKPNEPSILASLGRLEIELGNAEAALTALNQALQLQPSFPEASLERESCSKGWGNTNPHASALKASTQPALSATMQNIPLPNCIFMPEHSLKLSNKPRS